MLCKSKKHKARIRGLYITCYSEKLTKQVKGKVQFVTCQTQNNMFATSYWQEAESTKNNDANKKLQILILM